MMTWMEMVRAAGEHPERCIYTDLRTRKLFSTQLEILTAGASLQRLELYRSRTNF